MRRISTIALATALAVAIPLTATAQGWGRGPGGGQGRGMGWGAGPCAQGNPSECWRVKSPERHATCWSKANDKRLRGPARRTFMTGCMTQ